MKKLAVALTAMLAIGFLGGIAAAHPRQYVNWSPGVVVSASQTTACPPNEIDTAKQEIGFGGVKFCPGDVTPNGLGQASLTINDLLNNPSVGVYCQDLNADTFCGGNAAIIPPAPYGYDPLTGIRGEPRVAFCGSITLQSPIDVYYKTEPEWADTVNFGGNWDPAVAIIVFTKGYAAGNAAYAPCGLAATASPTTGTITH